MRAMVWLLAALWAGLGGAVAQGTAPAAQTTAAKPEPWTRPGRAAGEQITGPDGGLYVWVPAGEFVMGSTDAQVAQMALTMGSIALALKDERPSHAVRLSKGFWLAKHEVTMAQYARFLATVGNTADKDSHAYLAATTDGLDVRAVGWRFRARVPAGRRDHPVTDVTWFGAKAYCDQYGLALPTEAEWEYAARGSEGRVFPWGDEWVAGNCCNATSKGPGGRTAAVGSRAAGASWCGALDMAGNVWEWCADRYDKEYYAKSPAADPVGPDKGETRVLRGGSSVDRPDHCRSADRSWFVPAESCANNGFRACIRPSAR